MLKEIIASDTGLIFRRSALERAHIDMDELVQAAERTKLEDAKHKQKLTEDQAAARASTGGDTDASPNATLKISAVDGGTAVPVLDSDDGKLAKDQLESQSLYERWKTSSGALDAVCKYTDELVIAPAWWLLEFLPFIDSNQDEHGHWKNRLRYVHHCLLFPPVFNVIFNLSSSIAIALVLSKSPPLIGSTSSDLGTSPSHQTTQTRTHVITPPTSVSRSPMLQRSSTSL